MPSTASCRTETSSQPADQRQADAQFRAILGARVYDTEGMLQAATEHLSAAPQPRVDGPYVEDGADGDGL